MKYTEALKVAKPILFNTEMVRAEQRGLKTVTRRIVMPQPKSANDIIYKHPECGKWFISPDNDTFPEVEVKPKYKVGDILYVRETFARLSCIDCHSDGIEPGTTCCCKPDKNHGCFAYKATDYTEIEKWRPSIHMPKEAARIFLRVTDVRVERLQEITPEQIDAEGCKEYAYDAETRELIPSSNTYFRILWDSTIKKSDLDKYGWNANPWVWVFEFEKLEFEN